MAPYSDIYDEARVAAISSRLASAIDAAALACGSWDDVPGVLSDAFPGSFGGLWNMNFERGDLNFLAIRNMEPSFIQSFQEHFAFINPWSDYWVTTPPGAALSEEVCPARRFVRTEFYNDWLMPQDVEAAAGLKAVGEREELIQFMIHYPLPLSERYGRAAMEVLNRVRGSLERSIRLARLMRGSAESRAAGAALVERSRCAALVVDDNRKICDANDMASELFSVGSALSVRCDRCRLADRDADARFGMMLKGLANGAPVEETSIVYRSATRAWQVVLAALPVPQWTPPVLSLLPPRRLILVLVNEIAMKDRVADLSALAAAYGLTPAEIRFCRRMMQGESVSQAADSTGVTLETARKRLKSVFQKTNLSRQGQLMLLLSDIH